MGPEPPRRPASSRTPDERADRLKERVYITFTALAVVLALRSHGEPSWRDAATTLVIAVVGTLLAVLVADVVSHVAVHETLPTRVELTHMVTVTSSAAAVLVLPLLFLGLAAVGRWEIDHALRASTIALVATLVAVGYLAARRARLTPLQRVVVLFAEFALGALVVALELLAHG